MTDTLPEWAAALCRNDTATVRALYKMHFPGVKQYVLQNSGTSDDAQDVFQEAISVLWLSVKEGRLVAGTDPGGKEQMAGCRAVSSSQAHEGGTR